MVLVFGWDARDLKKIINEINGEALIGLDVVFSIWHEI